MLDAQASIATDLMSVDGVTSVLPFGVSADRSTLAFQVVPTTGPADPATVETVRAIHFSADTYARHTGTDIGLTGSTVANIEISERLGAALPPYLLVVVGLSLVILMLVFRSIVVPVVATAGFLLSVGAAFGVTVAVHQWGWLGGLLGVTQPGPLLSFMPIILIGVLFGLAMDYQMFLVSGMHEARSHGEDSRTAVRTGFVHGAKVVTAAAIIMTSVFLGFAFSHLVMIRPIGFALAVGVLVDAVLVRMTLTPAVMHLLGDRAWYIPRWLDRLLPDLDVEGVKLAERLEVGRAGRRAHGIRAGAATEREAEQGEPEPEPEPDRPSRTSGSGPHLARCTRFSRRAGRGTAPEVARSTTGVGAAPRAVDGRGAVAAPARVGDQLVEQRHRPLGRRVRRPEVAHDGGQVAHRASAPRGRAARRSPAGCAPRGRAAPRPRCRRRRSRSPCSGPGPAR